MSSKLQYFLSFKYITQAKRIINLLLLSNLYPVTSYQRVQKESDELLYIRFGRSLWSAISCQRNLVNTLLRRTIFTLNILSFYFSNGNFKVQSDSTLQRSPDRWASRMCQVTQQHWFLQESFQRTSKRIPKIRSLLFQNARGVEKIRVASWSFEVKNTRMGAA